MKKFLLLIFLIIMAPVARAYVSPENYAINEADLTDYKLIAPAPKLDIDQLGDDRFQAPNLIEKDFQISEMSKNSKNTKNTKKVKSKKQKDGASQIEETKTESEKPNKEVRKGFMYKIAKWWVDERYKREEPHHGALHEIKIQKRMEYELRQAEALKAKQNHAEAIDINEYSDNQETDTDFSVNDDIQKYEPNPALFL